VNPCRFLGRNAQVKVKIKGFQPALLLADAMVCPAWPEVAAILWLCFPGFADPKAAAKDFGRQIVNYY